MHAVDLATQRGHLRVVLRRYHDAERLASDFVYDPANEATALEVLDGTASRRRTCSESTPQARSTSDRSGSRCARTSGVSMGPRPPTGSYGTKSKPGEPRCAAPILGSARCGDRAGQDVGAPRVGDTERFQDYVEGVLAEFA
jgi:hypothetical protein